jgi:hypothetical protein
VSKRLESKVCSGCKEEKDVSLFYADKRLKSGFGSRCKACHLLVTKKNSKLRGWTEKDKETRYNRQYSLKPGEYAAMLENQDYKCAICVKTEQENNKRLAVDHCHETGKVRKLLCHHCNCALGMVNDSEDILISMLSYLKENK